MFSSIVVQTSANFVCFMVFLIASGVVGIILGDLIVGYLKSKESNRRKAYLNQLVKSGQLTEKALVLF